MADITICRSDDCPIRETCYRYLAEPDKKWQSYSYCSCVCDEKNGYRYRLKLIKDGNTVKECDS